MLNRIRLLSPVLLALAVATVARAANLDGSTPEAGNAEAARLYAEANAFVSNMQEGQYSYSYLQFYWKRAQSNIDRVRRVYPDSPTARQLTRGELKAGPYSLDYFRDNLLYNLELKRLGAFDDVNCAIFLYGRDPSRNDARRDEALSNIVEVLARRQRWEEALRFPVLSVHRPLLLGSIYKVAAFYGADAQAKRIYAIATAGERKEAGLDALTAEGLALQGKPRADLYKFIADHPTSAVRKAALEGVVDREILIRRMERLHVPFRNAIQTVHVVVQNTSLRDDVNAVALKIYNGSLDEASSELEVYSAAEGTAPSRVATIQAHLAHQQYLADSGRIGAAATYARDNNLPRAAARRCQLEVISLYAAAGQLPEAEKARMAYTADFSEGADEAALAEFRGRMESADAPFVAREKSFADLPISDPCVMATAIMEWSLSPSRSQHGATPWDAIIFRYAGGFDNLPKPKSSVVGDAASTLKPY
ncbi:MAG TPA: hypothetical protein VFE25_03480 [Opitutaceae bacterium]|jgi:hypothetical protein|nr:hypothetical protein [Opitutaceae bacterium]